MQTVRNGKSTVTSPWLWNICGRSRSETRIIGGRSIITRPSCPKEVAFVQHRSISGSASARSYQANNGHGNPPEGNMQTLERDVKEASSECGRTKYIFIKYFANAPDGWLDQHLGPLSAQYNISSAVSDDGSNEDAGDPVIAGDEPFIRANIGSESVLSKCGCEPDLVGGCAPDTKGRLGGWPSS